MKRDEPVTHKVKINNEKFEYPIIDHFNTLAGKEVEFRLNWEHMPVVGPILKVILYNIEKHPSRKLYSTSTNQNTF
jgi:hypothetical protein